ncbi:ABC transporter permease [Tepidibacter aestuarii]|uniref:ABC transporter permease n=1 Tax=Tepidibacter aestuarii TaxID=2925782 RepID=UPI0020BDE22E|nr:ABC transporter permease [Tepidibacter aestuarii]
MLIINTDVNGVSEILNDQYFLYSVRNTLIAGTIASIISIVFALGFGYYHLFFKDTLSYKFINVINELPVVLPHTVAGLALLLAFGRNTMGFISNTGLAFSFSALIIGMVFISYPFAARTLSSSIDLIDENIINVARTLGDSPQEAYFKIVIPHIKKSLISAFLLSFSRTISEFAVLMIFAGNMPRKTQVISSYVFTKIEEGEIELAITASIFSLVFSFILIFLMKFIEGRNTENA